MYFIPRIVVLNLTLTLPALICESPVPSTRNDEVYRVQRTPRLAQEFMASEHCHTISWILEYCLLSTVLLLMGLQFWSGLKLRQYAHYLEMHGLQTDAKPDGQKEFLEKLTYNDGC
jgi:hypothetical protein